MTQIGSHPAPRASHPAPRASHLAPRTSHGTSHLAPHTAPRTPHLAPPFAPRPAPRPPHPAPRTSPLMITFLSPWFLAGSAAVAVPIVLHLLKWNPEVRVKFAAVDLLRDAPVENTERRRLRQLL